MTDRDDRSMLDDDDHLVARLGHALEEHDPVPADAVAAARAAAALGRADEALAELLFDSLLDEPELAMRSDVRESRALAFEGSGGQRLDVDLLDDGAVVLGQLDPVVASVVVDLETADGARTTTADDLGRFRFADARGPMRLRLRLDDRDLVTPWITW